MPDCAGCPAAAAGSLPAQPHAPAVPASPPAPWQGPEPAKHGHQRSTTAVFRPVKWLLDVGLRRYCRHAGRQAVTCSSCGVGFYNNSGICTFGTPPVTTPNCATKFYYDGSKCTACDVSCASCYGSGSGSCSSCAVGFYNNSGKCTAGTPPVTTPNCATKFYYDGSKCASCDLSCASCYGSGSKSCYSCATGFYNSSGKCAVIIPPIGGSGSDGQAPGDGTNLPFPDIDICSDFVFPDDSCQATCPSPLITVTLGPIKVLCHYMYITTVRKLGSKVLEFM